MIEFKFNGSGNGQSSFSSHEGCFVYQNPKPKNYIGSHLAFMVCISDDLPFLSPPWLSNRYCSVYEMWAIISLLIWVVVCLSPLMTLGVSYIVNMHIPRLSSNFLDEGSFLIKDTTHSSNFLDVHQFPIWKNFSYVWNITPPSNFLYEETFSIYEISNFLGEHLFS